MPSDAHGDAFNDLVSVLRISGLFREEDFNRILSDPAKNVARMWLAIQANPDDLAHLALPGDLMERLEQYLEYPAISDLRTCSNEILVQAEMFNADEIALMRTALERFGLHFFGEDRS